MKMANTFRFTADVVSGSQSVHVSGEFSAPNDLHENVKIGSNTLELIRVGSRTFRRDAAAVPWQLATAARSAVPADPRSAFSTLTGVTAITLKGSSYMFTLTDGAAANLVQGSTTVTGTATLNGRWISDLRYGATSPSVSIHLTYRDVNSTPAVKAPAVGNIQS